MNRVAVSTRPSPRAQLRQLIRKVATGGRGGPVRRLSLGPEPVNTPIPQFDRRSTVMRALGIQPLHFAGTVTAKRRFAAGERVHVYLDVSGSMDGVCNTLYGAVLDCRDLVHPVVHLFSTEIADVTLVDLRKGVRRSTDGTALGCVAEHLETHRIRRALIITDGAVRRQVGAHLQILSRTCLAVAYAGASIQIDDLAAVARYSAQLGI
jgi:hypothetical protein